MLGVLFTIPLRRALVTNSDLPYPEGVAAAEVLKVGSGRRGETKDEAGESREGLTAVILGSVASAGLAVVAATRIAAGGIQSYVALSARVASGYDIAFSLALLGAGHLVGLSVGMAMLTGLLIAWVGGVPILTYLQPAACRCRSPHPRQHHLAAAGAIHRRRHDRCRSAVDAGQTRQASRRRSGRHHRLVASNGNRRRTGSEISVQAGSSVSPWPAWYSPAWLSLRFIAGTPLAPDGVRLTAFAVIFVLIVGFLIAGICGYMAGLIGASNSPISGVGILSIVTCAAILLLFVAPATPRRAPRSSHLPCS